MAKKSIRWDDDVDAAVWEEARRLERSFTWVANTYTSRMISLQRSVQDARRVEDVFMALRAVNIEVPFECGLAHTLREEEAS